MSETEQIHRLIADIYDAALDPSQWSAALGKARDFVGGSAVSLCWTQAGGERSKRHRHHAGIAPRHAKRYFDDYVELDPLTNHAPPAEVGQLVCAADIMAYDKFCETRFYKEWMQPQGLVDFAAAVLDRSTAGACLFRIFRTGQQGRVDDNARRRLRQIAPHIRRAMAMSRAIDDKIGEAAAFAETMDALSAGMILVDAAGRIVRCNASARALLADGSALRAAGDRLVAAGAGADRSLKKIFAASGGSGEAIGMKSIAVPLRGCDGAGYTAHVLPLASRHRGTAARSVAAVFVRRAAIEAPSLDAIARHFRLTPGELRVLLAVVRVGGVPGIAAALGIGRATVRTHLHRVFGKTGTSRQADLVRLVAGFANPLLN